MMKLFYDPLQNKWGHRHSEKRLVWGKQRKSLPRQPFIPSLSFKASRRGKRIGPLVGILTSTKGTTFAGNRTTFRRIHHALQLRGGIVFVFTPLGVKHHHINAYIYDGGNRRWIKARVPLPDVIYNRVPVRKDEETEEIQSCLTHLESLGIPYFNAGFLDKWKMYKCLGHDPVLEGHLPNTTEISSSELQKALYQWGEFYLKPKAGQKGDGIWAVELASNGTIICRTHETTTQYGTVEELWNGFRPDSDTTSYLLQRKVHLATHNGKPYDFRLMMQKVSGVWELTGAGARLAGEESITTHVPKGGELLALNELEPPVDLEHLTAICRRAAERLEESFSPLEELSF
ncbi:MAG TPA: YheC/YheD family protein, partial [Bacillales bacterium]